jgi:signal peptidase I
MQSLSETEYLKLLDEILQSGKTVHISVRGMSMFPFLMQGDIIQVTPVGEEKLQRGKVIVFNNGKYWVAHRLIETDQTAEWFLTRGDGNLSIDSPVHRSEIKGIVTGIIKNRMLAARFAIGIAGPFLAWLSPITGPVFHYMGIVAYRIKRALRGSRE